MSRYNRSTVKRQRAQALKEIDHHELFLLLLEKLMNKLTEEDFGRHLLVKNCCLKTAA
jgi:hypothetical protein